MLKIVEVDHTSNLASEFFRLRHKLFVEHYGWSLSSSDGMEIDQYDTDDATYILALSSGEVVGGTRVIDCTTKRSGWSYLLRDGALGKLKDVRFNVDAPLPVDANSYEVTRFTVSCELDSNDRKKILANVAIANHNFMKKHNAKAALFYMQKRYAKWFAKLGIDVDIIGPGDLAEDGQNYFPMRWVNKST